MTKDQFLSLMKFPKEWDTWGMYPDELFEAQLSLYRPGDERGAEHDRNGAFHWWLRRSPTAGQLEKLRKLIDLEPDPGLAEDMRSHLPG